MAEPKPRKRRSDADDDGALPRRRSKDADTRAEDGTESAARRRKPAQPEPERRRRAEKRDAPDRPKTRSRTRESDGSRPEEGGHSGTSRSEREDRSTGPRAPGIDARHAASAAAGYVQELTGSRPQGLTSLDHTDDGWRIGVEVLESRRIPDSTDILAEYQVDLDRDGDLISYRRERRYHRGRVEGDRQ